MQRKWLKVLGGVLAVILLLVMGYYVGVTSNARNPLHRAVSPMDKLKATVQMISDNYVDSVNEEELVSDLIPLLINQLDPHSTYLTAEERQTERETLDGYFYGVGITFNTIIDTAVVIRTIPNGPSDIAGLKAGDRIVTVDGRDITGDSITPDSVRALLKGPKGTLVTLGIRPYNCAQISEVKVKRGVVNTSSVDASIMVNDSLGFVRLSSFGMATYDDFMQAVAKLRHQGAKGLIIDLRDNPGGLMQAAVLIANEILPRQSLIIYTDGAHQERSDIYSDGTGTLIGFPIYVLINELSASSSEIVSGSLQDNDAGIVIGRRSFGKGLVQKPFEYYDGSSVHLTVARYHTASGRSIQRDYKLGGDDKYARDWIDRVLGGEMFSADSIKIDKELVYHTKGGREVYGGGGIMPDQFVPRDTVGMNSYYAEVLNRGIVHEFAFEYADRHRSLLSRLDTAESVYAFLSHQGLVWQLASYAQKKGVPRRSFLIAQAEKPLSEVLYRFVADFLFGSELAWRITCYNDPMVQKATQLFGAGVYSPMDLPQNRIMDTTNSVESDGEERD